VQRLESRSVSSWQNARLPRRLPPPAGGVGERTRPAVGGLACVRPRRHGPKGGVAERVRRSEWVVVDEAALRRPIGFGDARRARALAGAPANMLSTVAPITNKSPRASMAHDPAANQDKH
jgi:hypothetical protein